jgi:hypothetical protein
MLTALAALALVAPLQDAPAPPTASGLGSTPMKVDADGVRTYVARGVRWLRESQHEDGSWGSGAMDSVQFTIFSPETYYCFQVGANGLGLLALLSVERTAEVDAAAQRSFEWLSTTRVPKRGNDWDVDYAWAALYGFQAMFAAHHDARFDEAQRARAKERGLEYYAILARIQEPLGGWGYYEGPVVSQRPTWSTSFATANVVPALVAAVRAGWPVDGEVVARSVRYVKQCRMPNGAYSYDLRPIPRIRGESIDNPKGALGRIQVCNWALRRAGENSVTDETIREGLEVFFEEHRFLDVARMRPIPHEAYYANAAYFYLFAHCYAAQVINELPEAERADWHQRLRGHLTKLQWSDGSSIDFPNMSCMQVAGTAFSVLALQAGLPGSDVVL